MNPPVGGPKSRFPLAGCIRVNPTSCDVGWICGNPDGGEFPASSLAPLQAVGHPLQALLHPVQAVVHPVQARVRPLTAPPATILAPFGPASFPSAAPAGSFVIPPPSASAAAPAHVRVLPWWIVAGRRGRFTRAGEGRNGGLPRRTPSATRSATPRGPSVPLLARRSPLVRGAGRGGSKPAEVEAAIGELGGEACPHVLPERAARCVGHAPADEDARRAAGTTPGRGNLTWGCFPDP